MNILTAKDFKAMIKSGAANLENHRQEIDTLNIFPVPDGDTGTNMSMTFTSGYLEAFKSGSDSVSDIAKALSKGLLLGARGNSGVITSQIFRGFYQSIEGKDEISTKDVANAFENGARVAYKAIMKPVEGTILTVIRESSWYANHDMETTSDIDLPEYFRRLTDYAKESLDHTPDYLDVLREVGVVDSGGTGLYRIIEGFKLYFEGKPVEFLDKKEEVVSNPALEFDVDEYGYCTEFIIRLNEEYNNDAFKEDVLKNKLSKIGESLVVVKDDDLVKVHVHTLKPGDALNTAQRYGEFIKLKIENMQEQHSSIIASNEKKNEVEMQEYGLIVVAAGEGLVNLFKEYGADAIIEGGQTMNPSTEDFVEKIEELSNCKHLFIFPNNSNIILAAKQAQSIMTDRDITVIETTSIQQAITAVGLFNRMGSVEDNFEDINAEIKNIDSASLTYAIKDTTVDGVAVREGDYLAILNKHIVCSDANKLEAIKTLLTKMLQDDEKEILTIIKGENANDEDLIKIGEFLNETTDIEVNIIDGKQPVYEYLFSLE